MPAHVSVNAMPLCTFEFCRVNGCFSRTNGVTITIEGVQLIVVIEVFRIYFPVSVIYLRSTRVLIIFVQYI